MMMNELIADLIAAGLDAANPSQAIHRYLQLDGDLLIIEHRHYDLANRDVLLWVRVRYRWRKL
jgi:hypothetical protein